MIKFFFMQEKLPNPRPLDINSCSANWTDIEDFIESVVQVTAVQILTK